jgi:hypothetical protein
MHFEGIYWAKVIFLSFASFEYQKTTSHQGINKLQANEKENQGRYTCTCIRTVFNYQNITYQW